MSNTLTRPALFFVLIAMLMVNIGQAQLGADAGDLYFNVSTGYNQTLQTKIFDSSSNMSIYFFVVAPSFKQTLNGTTPTMLVSPQNGTMTPQQSVVLNMTVFMPSDITPGTTWRSAIEVIEASNSSSFSSGRIEGGIEKTVIVSAISPPVSFFQYSLIAMTIVSIIAVGMFVYYLLLIQTKKARRRGRL